MLKSPAPVKFAEDQPRPMPLFSLRGEKPDLPPRGQFYVAETALLIARVRLKAGASVWFNSVLRGDNEWIEIGERTNIQDNCTLHTDPGYPLTVRPGSTIGHNAILHGCTIGSNTLVGMGAILLNGAQIGDNCVIGAGALVSEGKVVPDNTVMVGSPARKLRDVDEAGRKLNERAAEVYFQRWQAYACDLQRIL